MRFRLQAFSAVACLVMLALPAMGQSLNVPVFQSGLQTPRHAPMFLDNGVIGDSGPAGGGGLGVGLSELNITNTGTPSCINDVPVTDPGGYHQVCFGANFAGKFIISMQSYAGAPAQNCFFNINGVESPCVSGAAGLPTVPGNTALRALAASSAALVIRLDFEAGFGALPMYFLASSSPCGSPPGDDGGSCVAASDGGSWHGVWQNGLLDVQEFGVDMTGATNATVPMQAALDAASRIGLDASVSNGTVLVSTVNVYSTQKVKFRDGACLKSAVAGGPAIATLPSVGAAIGQVVQVVLEDVCVNMNGNAGAAILFESTLNSRIIRPRITGVGGGTFTHNSYTFPSTGIIIAGSNASGSFYNVVEGGFVAPATDTQGIGAWIGSEVLAPRANYNTIQNTVFHDPGAGGVPLGFDTAIYLENGGDIKISRVDASHAASYGIRVGNDAADSTSVQRYRIEQVYLESDGCGIFRTSNASQTLGITVASTAGTPTASIFCGTGTFTGTVPFTYDQTAIFSQNHAYPPNPSSNSDTFSFVTRDNHATRVESQSVNGVSEMTVERALGTATALTNIVSGNELGRFSWRGYDGTAWEQSAYWSCFASEDWTHTPVSIGTGCDFFSTPIGGAVPLRRWRFAQSSGVMIADSSGTLPSGPPTGGISAQGAIWQNGNDPVYSTRSFKAPLGVSGCILSTDNSLPLTTLHVTGGCYAEDTTHTGMIQVPSQLTIVTGTVGANGLDSGTVAASTTYAVFILGQPVATATAAGLLSTSFTAPVLPAPYTLFRRVGAIMTDGSSNIIGFSQVAGSAQFYLAAQAQVSQSIAGTQAGVTLPIPVGVSLEPIGCVSEDSSAPMIISALPSTGEPNTAPSATVFSLAQTNVCSSLAGTITSTAAAIALRTSGATVTARVNVRGWIDFGLYH